MVMRYSIDPGYDELYHLDLGKALRSLAGGSKSSGKKKSGSKSSKKKDSDKKSSKESKSDIKTETKKTESGGSSSGGKWSNSGSKGSDGKMNNSSEYNHDYYIHHKSKWLDDVKDHYKESYKSDLKSKNKATNKSIKKREAADAKQDKADNKYFSKGSNTDTEYGLKISKKKDGSYTIKSRAKSKVDRGLEEITAKNTGKWREAEKNVEARQKRDAKQAKADAKAKEKNKRSAKVSAVKETAKYAVSSAKDRLTNGSKADKKQRRTEKRLSKLKGAASKKVKDITPDKVKRGADAVSRVRSRYNNNLKRRQSDTKMMRDRREVKDKLTDIKSDQTAEKWLQVTKTRDKKTGKVTSYNTIVDQRGSEQAKRRINMAKARDRAADLRDTKQAVGDAVQNVKDRVGAIADTAKGRGASPKKKTKKKSSPSKRPITVVNNGSYKPKGTHYTSDGRKINYVAKSQSGKSQYRVVAPSANERRDVRAASQAKQNAARRVTAPSSSERASTRAVARSREQENAYRIAQNRVSSPSAAEQRQARIARESAARTNRTNQAQLNAASARQNQNQADDQLELRRRSASTLNKNAQRRQTYSGMSQEARDQSFNDAAARRILNDPTIPQESKMDYQVEKAMYDRDQRKRRAANGRRYTA